MLSVNEKLIFWLVSYTSRVPPARNLLNVVINSGYELDIANGTKEYELEHEDELGFRRSKKTIKIRRRCLFE